MLRKYREFLEPHGALLVGLAKDLSVVGAYKYSVVLNHGVDRYKLNQKLADSGAPTGIQFKFNNPYTFYQSFARSPLDAVEDIYFRLLVRPLPPNLTTSDAGVTVKSVLQGLSYE